jgi:hypothetical protein
MHHRILSSFLPHDRSSRVHQGATDRMSSPLPHGSIRPLSSASASLVPALCGSYACLSVISPWESSTAPVVISLPDNTSSAVWSPRNLHPSPTDRVRDLLPNTAEVLTRELEGETPSPAAGACANGQILLFVQVGVIVREMGKRLRSPLPKLHATPVAIAMDDHGAQFARLPRGQHEGHSQQVAWRDLVRDMAQGAVDRHPLQGEVADYPQPSPPIGGGIIHPQGDGAADGGARVPRPACAPRCGGTALGPLHRPPFQDHDGAPLAGVYGGPTFRSS